jgi:hypothetical protein
MSTGDEATAWWLAGVGAVISTLASSLAYVFRLREKEIRERIDALEEHADTQENAITECREDRQRLSIEVATLRGELNAHLNKKP